MNTCYEELKKLYIEFGEDISQNELMIDEELVQLGLKPFNIKQSFLSMVDKWEGIKLDDDYTRIKIARSLTILPVVEAITKIDIPRELKSLLILLDAMINATDDIIDTKSDDITDKVSNAIIIHFGNTLAQKTIFRFLT